MKPKKTIPKKKTAPRSEPASGETEFYARAAKTSAGSGTPPKKTRSADPETPIESPRKAASRKTAMNVPPILLEGDKPPVTKVSGPGQRYALGPTPPQGQLEDEGELPQAYGTRQLLLAARDPHWLYVHWDLTHQQQRHYNAQSRDRHLVVRVFQDALSGKPDQEVHVHPESFHWFIHVNQAGAKYLAELGYYSAPGDWVTISTSGPTLTPPETVSEDTTVEFANIPYELPMANLLSLVKEAAREHAPLARALEDLRRSGHPELPKLSAVAKPAPWTPAQERALADVISMDQVRRVWMGSLEITELIRRQAAQELASMAAAGLAGALPGAPTSPSGIFSPLGRQPEKGFWFNVNAELIIYGATEPDATVTIGGRKIRLRPDGSFSYRFALPDGRYELPIVAVSADGTDGRAAEMHFSRGTEYRGEVGEHPQDAELKRPAVESL